MAKTNRQRIDETLEILREGLIPFAEQELSATYGDDWITNANFFFLIRADGTPFEIFEGHGYPLYLAGVVSLSLLVLYLWYLPVKFFMSPERKQHESIS